MRNALLIFLLLCQCVLNDTPETVVLMEPVIKDMMWKRVVKRVEVTYTYNIVGDSQFHQFPDFALAVNLPFQQQYVKIQYNIQNWLPKIPSGRFWTRVIIDGQEPYRQFRVATGDGTVFHSNHISREVLLSKGVHRISVQYYSNTERPGGQYMQSWNVAVFSVTYYQPLSSS